MKRTPLLIAIALLATVTSLAVAGCGGDDDGDDGATTNGVVTDENVADEPIEPDVGESEQPSSGIEAAPPKQVQSCLEAEGFQVSIDDATPESITEELGIETQLAVLGDEDVPGAGAITYFTTEPDAIAGAQANDEAKVPNTVLGRKGKAAYTFTGEGLEDARTAIQGCL